MPQQHPLRPGQAAVGGAVGAALRAARTFTTSKRFASTPRPSDGTECRPYLWISRFHYANGTPLLRVRLLPRAEYDPHGVEPQAGVGEVVAQVVVMGLGGFDLLVAHVGVHRL